MVTRILIFLLLSCWSASAQWGGFWNIHKKFPVIAPLPEPFVHLPFDTAVDGTNTPDVSVNAKTAWLFGNAAIVAGGAIGNCVELDGAGDYVRIFGETNLYNIGTGDATISAWVKSRITGTQGVMGRMDSAAAGPGMYLRLTTTTPYPFISTFLDDGPDTENPTYDMVPTNEWHLITVVWDRDVGVSTYTNGVLMTCVGNCGNNIANVGSIDNAFDWGIGTRSVGNNGNYFNGFIDDARFYTNAITAAHVLSLYDERD